MKTILVVDDDTSVSQASCRILRAIKYETLTVVNGKEAIEVLAQHPEIALVLTDWEMPEMDGIELTKQLKTIHPQLPIIFYSGKLEYLGKRNNPSKQEIGADFYLPKPFQFTDLEGAVKSLLPEQQPT